MYTLTVCGDMHTVGITLCIMYAFAAKISAKTHRELSNPTQAFFYIFVFALHDGIHMHISTYK